MFDSQVLSDLKCSFVFMKYFATWVLFSMVLLSRLFSVQRKYLCDMWMGTRFDEIFFSSMYTF